VLLVTRPQKSRQKGESSKGSKRTWSPSEEEYLISRWAEADCLFNTCSADFNSWVARDVIIFENPKLESHQSYYLHQA